jgi:hypothetical protein
MPNDNITCYETADASLFTLFDTGKDGSYLLPYTGLLAAHLPPPADGGTEQMTLLYVTHTVVITGTNLTALLDTIQRGRAKKIYTGEDKAKTAAKNPAIRAIKITPGQDATNQ